MLDKINDNDKLYVIGDLLDRLWMKKSRKSLKMY